MIPLIGVDIGQRRDPTAICVAERDRRRRDQRKEAHYLIRHLERLPPGTLYPEIARRVSRVAAGVRRRCDRRPPLYVNATGLGAPIVDLLKKEASDLGRTVEVYFTHGDQRTEERKPGRRQVKLGKAFLVSRLQALLQTGRLHLPRTAEAETLAEELLAFEIRVGEDANDRYGAFPVGTHDDLVTALGLSVEEGPAKARIF